MKIACLHTADSNAPLFDAVCPAGVVLAHHVRTDLYARAIALGQADEAILAETAAALSGLRADAVLLTCSTLGPAAPRAGALRVDEALAAATARAATGGLVEVLVTTPTTIVPTRALFAAAGIQAPRVTLIDGALDCFVAGELDAYYQLIAAAVDRSDAATIALAQASMAPAAAMTRKPVLTSPKAGLTAAMARAKTNRQPGDPSID